MMDVLVIDDDEAMRDMLYDVLSEAGYVVTLAESGQQGLDMVRQAETPSVVLIDYFMPGVDGLQVLQAIKRDAELQQHAYIFISGEERRFPPELTNTLAELRIPTVRKPFNLDEVLQTVSRAAARLDQPDEDSSPDPAHIDPK